MTWGFERINGRIVKRHKCKKCKTTDRPHYSKGLCSLCYEKTRRDYKAEYWRTHYGKEERITPENVIKSLTSLQV